MSGAPLEQLGGLRAALHRRLLGDVGSGQALGRPCAALASAAAHLPAARITRQLCGGHGGIRPPPGCGGGGKERTAVPLRPQFGDPRAVGGGARGVGGLVALVLLLGDVLAVRAAVAIVRREGGLT